MRKFLIPLLMVGVVMPVAATAKERDFVGAIRERADEAKQEPSAESRPERLQRPDREERSERPVRAERAERPAPIDRGEQPVRVDRISTEQQVERQQVLQAEPVQRGRQTRRSGSSLSDGFRAIASEDRTPRDVEVRRGSNDGFTGQRRDRDGHRWSGDRDGHRWSGDWRRDHRYDWRSYRDRNRSLFRFGSYYDPYGYSYRRFSIGFNLWPSYYGSNYWLNDPWMYRLPPAYGPYRWVRYYDDALLVNIYTGQVVDVINNFFW